MVAPANGWHPTTAHWKPLLKSATPLRTVCFGTLTVQIRAAWLRGANLWSNFTKQPLQKCTQTHTNTHTHAHKHTHKRHDTTRKVKIFSADHTHSHLHHSMSTWLIAVCNQAQRKRNTQWTLRSSDEHRGKARERPPAPKCTYWQHSHHGKCDENASARSAFNAWQWRRFQIMLSIWTTLCSEKSALTFARQRYPALECITKLVL